MYTVKSVAHILGINERTVRWWLEKLGYEKATRDYIITDEMLERLKARKTKPGPEPTRQK